MRAAQSARLFAARIGKLAERRHQFKSARVIEGRESLEQFVLFAAATLERRFRRDGLRAGGAMFGDYVGLELETGWIFNEIKSIRGFTEPDGWLSQVPLLANVRFEFRNNSGLTPFIGGGAGGAVVGINLDNAQAGAVTVDGSAADLVFAWQAFGGLKYEVIENLSVGIIYKFFWTDDARWDVRGTSQDIHFDGTRTHSISAMVSYRF